MKTFVCVQLLLACISLSFNTLVYYHLANVGAQVFLLLHDVFPYKRIRYASMGILGLAFLSSGLAWLICAIRAWRYVFFPTKEGAHFFAECVVNVLSVLVQLIFMVFQAKELRGVRKVEFVPSLYTTCVYILFFHDFVYAALFIYSGGILMLFGYTQFIVHTLMLGLNTANVELFQYAWVALVVQHMVTVIWNLDDRMILVFTGVYIVADILYLINSTLQHQTSIVTRSIKQILGPEEARDE